MQKLVLALGSNLGQRLENIRLAVNLISVHIGGVQNFSYIYRTKALLPKCAPPDWNLDYYNAAVLLHTDLAPEEILFILKKIECRLGRPLVHDFWSPRKIDIDILSYGQRTYCSKNLTIPHVGLLQRNFALKPLLDVDPTWEFPGKKLNLHLHLKTMPQLKLAPFTIKGSKLMAIINLSKDSFSAQENLLLTKENFIFYILSCINQGAEVLDLGAESTRPNATIKTADECWLIIKPYLEILNSLIKSNKLPIIPLISIDTYHAKVIEKCLEYECVSMINDVFGVQKKAIASLLKNTKVKYVFMHHLGRPGDQYVPVKSNIIDTMVIFAQEQIAELTNLGLDKNQLIFDVGIGFGKYDFQARELISKISMIKSSINIEVLVGHSRKSSIMQLHYLKEHWYKDIFTALLTHNLLKSDVDYIRIHNINLSRFTKFI